MTPDDLYLARRCIEISKSIDEGKDAALHLSPTTIDLPWELGRASSQGLLSSLERTAETTEDKYENIRALAGHEAVRLNEQLGAEGDKGLIGRIALALSKIIPD